jgi:hypothetical protein
MSRLNGLTRTFIHNLISHLEGPHGYTTWIIHRLTEKGKYMHTEMLFGKIHRHETRSETKIHKSRSY